LCGIAAILLHPQERSASDWRSIGKSFTQNLLFNEERGRAATGLAVVQVDGQIVVLKRPVPASQFVTTPEYRALLSVVSPKTTLILGHTRAPTKGDPAVNDNNHPLQAGPVFGVHNGHIFNDDELFVHLSLPRSAQVDSEIIFRLLETVSPEALNGDYLSAARSRLGLLQGQFTFLACDRRNPARLLVLKHNNPLCLHYHRNWNALIFSSRYVFLRKAFKCTLAVEALEHNRLLLFDALTLPQKGSRPIGTIHLYTGEGDGE